MVEEILETDEAVITAAMMVIVASVQEAMEKENLTILVMAYLEEK